MGCSGAGCGLGLLGTIYFADTCALVLVVLCAGGLAAGGCCAVPRVAMQSSASITKATSTNTVDLFLSMNFDSSIDELSVLSRCRDPRLRFLVHQFFNAGAEILEHY